MRGASRKRVTKRIRRRPKVHNRVVNDDPVLEAEAGAGKRRRKRQYGRGLLDIVGSLLGGRRRMRGRGDGYGGALGLVNHAPKPSRLVPENITVPQNQGLWLSKLLE